MRAGEIPITIPKSEHITELPKELDEMNVESMEELDVRTLLAEPTEFIREGEYLENLLDYLLGNDDLLDEL